MKASKQVQCIAIMHYYSSFAVKTNCIAVFNWLPVFSSFTTKMCPCTCAILSLYRDKVAEEISRARYYSATTDLWSSERTKPYLSYTIHYIDKWELQLRCLQIMFIPQNHTGENLADAIRSTYLKHGDYKKKESKYP